MRENTLKFIKRFVKKANKILNMKNYIEKICAVMLGMIITFFCLQVLVFCIPQQLMKEEAIESREVLNEEGRGWEYIFSYARGAQLDTRTDDIMIERAVRNPDKSVLYNAMDCNGYPRYWHGYLAFLKPLMVLLSYSQIRYLYMVLYIALFTAVVIMLSRRINVKASYTWTASLIMVYFIILPFSLQYSSVFFLMFVAMLCLDKIYQGYNWKRMGIFFLVIGMITSYVDFLTAPLITLGMPLVYLILLQQKEYGDLSYKKNMSTVFVCSFLWGIGYLGNWAAKWVLASIVLGRNIIEDGLSQGINRVGAVEGQTSKLGAIAYNLFAIIPPEIEGKDLKWFVLFGAMVLIILGIVFWKRHAQSSVLKSQLPLLIVAVYPYIWYVIMSNHSQIHYIFTYRIQMITVWAGLMLYIQCIDKKGTALYCKETNLEDNMLNS